MIGHRWSGFSGFASAALLAVIALASPVNSLHAQTTAPTTAVGTLSAAQTATVTITTSSLNPVGKIAIFTRGVAGNLALDYQPAAGAPPAGSCAVGSSYTSPATCTVSYTFQPTRPGNRVGGIALYDTSGLLIGNTYLTGMGTGPQVAFPPTATTIPKSLYSGSTAQANGLTLDGAGDIFFVNGTSLQEILATNGSIGTNPTVTTVASGFTAASAVVIDGSGNLFVADSGTGKLLEIQLVNGLVPSNGTPTTVATGFTTPTSIRVDSKGDVYVADATGIKEVMATNGVIPASPTVTPLYTGTGVTAIAVDGSGDVFFNSGATAIDELVLGLPTPVGTASNTISALGIDGSGDIYVVSSAGKSVTEIVPTGGLYGVAATTLTLGTGYNAPISVAIDASGNIYVGDTGSGSGSILELNVQTPPAVTFTSTAGGSTSSDSPMTLTVANNGNAALTFPVPTGAATNPVVSAGFTVSGSSTCPQLTSASTAGTLAAGATCTDLISFTPAAVGAVTGTLTITDTNLNAPAATQTANLAGGLSSPTVTVSPASAVVNATSVTLTASVAYNGVTPSNGLSFSVNSTTVTATCSGTTTPLTCTGTYNPAGLTVGSYVVTATLNADTSTNSETGSGTLSITPGSPGVTFASPTYTSVVDGTVALTANITPTSGVTPTGKVSFTYGSGTAITGCTAVSLSNGSAQCSATGLPFGSDTVTATIASDNNFASNFGTATVNVGQATPGVSVVSNNPSVPVNGSVQFTASVTPTSGTTPTGSVTFTYGSPAVTISGCSGLPLSGGQAVCTTTSLPAGTLTITAAYGGDTNFVSSSGTTSQGVTMISPGVAVTSNNASIAVDGSVQFTATITPNTGTVPTGGVTFTYGTTTLCSNQTVTNSKATCTTTALPAGASDTVTATIAADNNFTSNFGTFNQPVTKSATNLAVGQPANSTVDGSVTFTATLTNTSGAAFTVAPTGTISWSSNTGCAASPLTQATTTTYTSTCSTNELVYPSDVVTASYATDSNYQASNGQITQTVAKNSATVSVASSAATAVVNQTVSFTATITPANFSTGGPLPGGSLTFTKGGATVCGPVVVTAGTTTSTATCNYAFPAAFAATAVTATYTPDSNFTAGTVTPVQQTVGTATTSSSVVSNIASPSVNGPVNLTATVSVQGGAGFSGTSVPQSGTLVLTDTTTNTQICSQTITASGSTLPSAVCQYSFSQSGNHNISSSYTPSVADSANFTASVVNPALTLSVGSASTTLIISNTGANTNPLVNQSVTFGAAFSGFTPGPGQAEPVGTVTYYDSLPNANTVLCTVNVVTSGATTGSIPACPETLTVAGTHVITAAFISGTGSAYGSIPQNVSPSYAQVVGKGTITVGLTSPTATTSTVNALQTFSATVTPTTTGAGTVNPSGGSITFNYTATYPGGGTASGTVCSATVSTTGSTTSGTCAAQQAFPQSGSYVVSATYSADNNFATTTSSSLTQTVGTTGTSLALTSPTATTSAVGASQTFTASITPAVTGATTPSGTVSFTYGSPAVTICSAPAATLNNATTASCIASPFTTAGTYTISVAYSGDANFTSSTKPSALTQVASKTGTTLALNSPTSTSSAVGASQTFTATLTPAATGGAAPTGTVTFSYISGANPAVTICTANVAASGNNSVATCSATPFTQPGTYSISASYSGDTNYTTSSTPALVQTASKTGTTLALTSPTSTTSAVGASQTFTATVTPSASVSTTPSGTVTFTYGSPAVTICTASVAPLSGVNSATCTASPFTQAGTYVISASYSGDANFTTSSANAALTQTVSKTSITIAITSPTTAPTTVDVLESFSATVTIGSTASTAPTGSLTFSYGNPAVTICTTAGISFGGGTTATATCSAPQAFVAPGTYAITATYSGDTNFGQASSSPITQVVNKTTTGLTIFSSGAPTSEPINTPLASLFSPLLTLTSNGASDTGSNFQPLAVPTGTVTITDSVSPGVTLCTGSVAANGTVTCTPASYTFTTGGPHTLTATYPGDANFSGMTAVSTITITQAAPTLTLRSSSTTSVATQTVVFTATVPPTGAGVLPTSTVASPITFNIAQAGVNNVYSCAAAPVASTTADTATCTISFPPTASGPYTVTASYPGDTNYTSTSGSLTQTVQNFTAPVITSTPTPVLMSQGNSLIANTNAADTFNASTIQYSLTPLSSFADATKVASCTVLSGTNTATGVTCAAVPTNATSGVITVSATAAAPVGLYTVQLTIQDAVNTALSQTGTYTTLNVIAQPAVQTTPSIGSVTETFTVPATIAPSGSALSCNSTSVAAGNTNGTYSVSTTNPLNFTLIGITNCTVTASGTSYTVTVTAGNSTAVAQLATHDNRVYAAMFCAPFLLLFGLLPAMRKHRKLLLRALSLLLIAAAVLQSTGCSSGGFNKPTQTYAVAGSYLIGIQYGTGTSKTTVAEVPVTIIN